MKDWSGSEFKGSRSCQNDMGNTDIATNKNDSSEIESVSFKESDNVYKLLSKLIADIINLEHDADQDTTQA